MTIMFTEVLPGTRYQVHYTIINTDFFNALAKNVNLVLTDIFILTSNSRCQSIIYLRVQTEQKPYPWENIQTTDTLPWVNNVKQ